MQQITIGNTTYIIPGNEVICDMCGADWTDRPESGSFLFGSYGVCPDCSERVMNNIKRYNEEDHIRATCPEGMSHADWIRDIVRTGKYKANV